MDTSICYYDTLHISGNFLTNQLYIDSNYVFEVHLKDTVNFKGLSMAFQGKCYFSTSKTPIQDFLLQIKSLYIGTQPLLLTSFYDSLGITISHIALYYINVVPNEQIKGFFLSPLTKKMNPTQKFSPQYNVRYNNFIANVRPDRDSISFAVADTNVVVFNNLEKKFIAKDSGSTFAIVNYKGFRDTIYFDVRNGIISPPVLPIDLIKFYASHICNSVYISWRTASEFNNSGFEIQQSTGANNWQKVAFVKGQGSSNSAKDYSYQIDNMPDGKYFYRLKQIDNDGKFTYSPIAAVNVKCIEQLRLMPNPATTEVTLQGLDVSKMHKIQVYDSKGALIKSAYQQSNIVSVKELPMGTYMLKVDGTISFVFVKQ